MSLQEPDIRCEWRTPFRPPHEDFPAVQCVEDATHVAFIGDRARPFCGRHSEHRAPGATLQHLIRDPRVGVLVAFAVAGYSDDTLDRLIADVVARSDGADVVLLDYVEQSGMADPGYRVTFDGRTWLEGSWPSLPRLVIENCHSPGCQREAGHPPPHRSRTDGGHGNIIEDEWESRDHMADAFLYGAQVLTRDQTP